MGTRTWKVWSRDKYTQGDNNIVADTLRRILTHDNQESTEESTYKKIASKTNELEEFTEVIFL